MRAQELFIAGDLVVVVECASLGASRFYPVGATGVIKSIDGDGDCWVAFDPMPGVRELAGKRTWCAVPERLRLVTLRRRIMRRLRLVLARVGAAA